MTCSGADVTGVGNGTQNNVTVNVQPGATITLGNNANAINLNNASQINNNGAINLGTGSTGVLVNGSNNTVTNGGGIAAGINGTGLNAGSAAGTGNNLTNNGSITLGDANGGRAVGISSAGNNANIVNNGSINVGNAHNGGDFAFGIANNGVQNVTIINNGMVTVGNAGNTSQAIGIAGFIADITNNGSVIGGSGSGSGSVTGIVGFGNAGNNVTNSATGQILLGDDAIGIQAAATGGTITNNGTIKVGNGVIFQMGGIAARGAVVNNGSITIGDRNGASFAVGIDAGSLLNTGSITTGANTNAVELIAQNGSATNNGKITAGNGSTGILLGTDGFGNQVNNAVITNGASGTINTGNNSAAIDLAAGTGSKVTNNGGINVGNFSAGVNGTGGGNTVTNGGSINLGTNGVGIQLKTSTGNNVTNSGSITGGNASIGIDVHDNNAVTNTSTGVISLNGATNGGLGINGGDGNNVTNQGRISAEHGISLSDGNLIVNSGTINLLAGVGPAGIVVLADNHIVNSGTITSSANAVGIAVQGPNNLIDNSGRVAVGGGAVEGTGGNDTLNNSGTIFSSGSAALVMTNGGNTVNNTGTIDGRIAMQKIPAAPNNVINNDGLITITSPDIAVGAVHALGGTFNQPDGTLALRVSPAGAHDSLSVTTANLGGTLGAVVQPGVYGVATTYLGVVNATDPITSRFANSLAFAAGGTSPLAFMTVTTTYNTNSVDITLNRSFSGALGETRNQRAVGAALDAGFATTPTGNGPAAVLLTHLLQSTSASVLDQISGEGTSATQETAFSAAGLFTSTMMDQANAFLSGAAPAGNTISVPASQYAATPPTHPAFKALAPRPYQPVWSAWGAGFGGGYHLDGDAAIGSADISHNTFGGAIGADYRTPNWLLGIAAGGSDSSFSVASRATSGDLNAGHVGIYGIAKSDHLYASGSLSYGHFDNSTSRLINIPALSERATGSFGSDLFGGRFETGWRQAVGAFTVTPFAALQFAQLWQSAYTETSVASTGAPGILGLSFASKTISSLPLFLGAQVETRMALANGGVWTPSLRVSWVHEFEPTRDVTATLVSLPGATFTVDGPRAASDAARVELGSKYAYSEHLSLFANFVGEFSDVSRSYAGTGGVRWAW